MITTEGTTEIYFKNALTMSKHTPINNIMILCEQERGQECLGLIAEWEYFQIIRLLG